jgi:copper transport protein
VRGIFDSDYGRALLVKLALVAVVGLLALWNRFVLVNAVRQRSPGAAQWRRLRGAVLDEAVIVVVALAVTGLLTMQTPPAPASGPSASRDSAGTAPVVREVNLGTGTVQGRLVRTSDGRNGVEIVLRDASGAVVEPVDPPKVTAALPADGLGPLPARLTDLEGTGRYGVEVPVPAPGEWEFTISARFSSTDNASATLVIPVPR